MTLRGVLDAAGWLVVAPGVILHELAHAVVGRLLGARTEWVWVLEDARPVTRLWWPSGAAEWRLRVAHLAPTLMFPVAVVAALAAVDVAFAVLESSRALVVGLVVAGNAVAFVVPSKSDLHPEVR